MLWADCRPSLLGPDPRAVPAGSRGLTGAPGSRQDSGTVRKTRPDRREHGTPRKRRAQGLMGERPAGAQGLMGVGAGLDGRVLCLRRAGSEWSARLAWSAASLQHRGSSGQALRGSRLHAGLAALAAPRKVLREGPLGFGKDRTEDPRVEESELFPAL